MIGEMVSILIDENIKPGVIRPLKEKGYNTLLSIDVLGHGERDCKILEYLKNKDMILVTCDYKFYKMAKKYLHGRVIYFEKEKESILNPDNLAKTIEEQIRRKNDC